MDKAKVLQLILLAVVFFTPLIYTSYTRELFEFPKMSFIYLASVLAVAAFLRKSGGLEKARLKETPWDKPLIFFFLAYLLSTLFSLNHYTSFFGYYSRFNGGFLSILSFIALYYLFADQAAHKSFVAAALRLLLLSGFLVSLLGVAQHFGFQRAQWVQDSAARVFSTLGQPNWLAAYLVMLLPPTVALLLLTTSFRKQLVLFLVAVSLYAAFWFTYSLSGLLSLLTAALVFFFLADKNFLRRKTKILSLLLATFFLISASQPGIFAPRLESFFKQVSRTLAPPAHAAAKSDLATALTPPTYEGDTFKIRSLVWQGAWQAVQKNPKVLLIGYGPETFAYAFLPFRSAALNLTSEWDFLYNKAHNDYLDILVNRGLLGLASYLYLVLSFGLYVIRALKKKGGASRPPLLVAALYAGWVGLLISNVSGWSVVATSLLFWLFPILAFRLVKLPEKEGDALF